MIADELRNDLRLTGLYLDGCCHMWRFYMDQFSDLAQAQERARFRAEHAILDGIKHNRQLQHFTVRGNGFRSAIESEIGVFLSLNRTGRYLLSSHQHGLAPTTWCYILAKCQAREPLLGTTLIYFYVKEQPTLMRSYGTGKSLVSNMASEV